MYTEEGSDYILLSDLTNRYHNFCRNRNISLNLNESLIGSPDLAKFGAKFVENMNMQYIQGLALYDSAVEYEKYYLPGLVRIPKYDPDGPVASTRLKIFLDNTY